jgi:Secretion system C-terminal sorting domain
VLTSSSNLGVVNVVRSHTASDIPLAGGTSIHRSYEISPTNNQNINTTVRLNYLDAELNGLTEANFSMFKNSGSGFTDMGFTDKSAESNYLMKEGINSFSVFTLSSITSGPLPISLVKFESKCNDNLVQINWETAYERNVKGFEVQKSSNATDWNLLATASAQNQGKEIINYNLADKANNYKNNYYRLISYELDGSKSISKVISATCAAKANVKVTPNPVIDIANLEISATESKSATLKMVNVNGQTVQTQKLNLSNSSNLFPINMTTMPKGVYFLEITQSDGANQKIKLIKN